MKQKPQQPLNWREYFAEQEAEQLKHLPVQQPETPLEKSLSNIAEQFLRDQLSGPGLKWNQQRFGPLEDLSIAFYADSPTRWAFFEYFSGKRIVPIPIYCLPIEQSDTILQSSTSDGRYSYATWDHQFLHYRSHQEARWDRFYSNAKSLASLPIEELFVQRWGQWYGPRAAQLTEMVWRWDGTKLEDLSCGIRHTF